jgi:hypothetical protein
MGAYPCRRPPLGVCSVVALEVIDVRVVDIPCAVVIVLGFRFGRTVRINELIGPQENAW